MSTTSQEAPARPQAFFEVRGIPAHVCVLWPDAESARACPRGDIALTFDDESGLIENQLFDEELVAYAEGYENSLHFSEFFQGYIDGFARDVIERHGLVGKKVVEIGCGDGQFLELLCAHGAAEAIGFDPSYPTARPDKFCDGRAHIVRDYYSKNYEDIGADAVVCRQVLEHVPSPNAFLASVRRALDVRPGAVVVFEVPNALYTLEELSLWDVIYEHRTYFSAGSLARLMTSKGFDVQGARETYARQFVAVEARTTNVPTSVPAEVDDVEVLTAQVERFAGAWQAKVQHWRDELDALAAAGKKVALWGTGARGVNFLNIADPHTTIGCVVDINPRKHGLHAAGSGQRIDAPEVLVKYEPDVVVVMNPNYLDEIRAALAQLGLEPDLRRA